MINRAALRLLYHTLEEAFCGPDVVAPQEDVMVALCFEGRGVQPLDVRDDKYRETFHTVEPGFFFRFSDGGVIAKYSVDVRRPSRDMISATSVAFHNMEPVLMQHMHDVLVRCGRHRFTEIDPLVFRQRHAEAEAPVAHPADCAVSHPPTMQGLAPEVANAGAVRALVVPPAADDPFRLQLFCLLIVTRPDMQDAALDTWLRQCDGAITSESTQEILMRIPASAHANTDGAWAELMGSLYYLGRYYIDRFQMFVVCTDEVYLLPSSLRAFITAQPPQWQNYFEPAIFGTHTDDARQHDSVLVINSGAIQLLLNGKVDLAQCAPSTPSPSLILAALVKCFSQSIHVHRASPGGSQERFHSQPPPDVLVASHGQQALNPTSVSYAGFSDPGRMRRLHARLTSCNQPNARSAVLSADGNQPESTRIKSRYSSRSLPFKPLPRSGPYLIPPAPQPRSEAEASIWMGRGCHSFSTMSRARGYDLLDQADEGSLSTMQVRASAVLVVLVWVSRDARDAVYAGAL